VGVRTVRKYLHAEGIWPKRGRPRGRYYPAAYTGAFVQWLRDHPQVQLPESPSEISRLSGCTVDEIKTHLYRLRRAIEREIASLPDLRSQDAVMETTEGVLVPFRAIDSYRVKIRKHSRKVRIEATLKGGKEVTLNTHLDYLWEVLPKGRVK
jgi:hypothetical protein